MAVKSQVREGDIIRVPEKRGAWVVIEAKMAGGGHCGLGGGDDYPDGWRVTCSLLDESPAAYQYNPLAPTFRFYQTSSWSGVPTYKAVEAFDAYRGGYPWGTAPDIEPEIGDRGVTLETNFKEPGTMGEALERIDGKDAPQGPTGGSGLYVDTTLGGGTYDGLAFEASREEIAAAVEQMRRRSSALGVDIFEAIEALAEMRKAEADGATFKPSEDLSERPFCVLRHWSVGNIARHICIKRKDGTLASIGEVLAALELQELVEKWEEEARTRGFAVVCVGGVESQQGAGETPAAALNGPLRPCDRAAYESWLFACRSMPGFNDKTKDADVYKWLKGVGLDLPDAPKYELPAEDATWRKYVRLARKVAGKPKNSRGQSHSAAPAPGPREARGDSASMYWGNFPGVSKESRQSLLDALRARYPKHKANCEGAAPEPR